MNTANTRRLTELVKSAKTVSPKNNADLLAQLTSLLSDYPDLQKIVETETVRDNTALKQPLFSIELPVPNDTVTRFYYLLIAADSLRIFNTVQQESSNWSELVDIRYQVNKTLTNIRVLAKQTASELIEQGFTTLPDEKSNHIHNTLYFLKHTLVALYFSVQESFKTNLKQVTTVEDFYILDLQEPLSNMLPLIPVEQLTESETDDTAAISQDKIHFGFKDDVGKLRTVINQLCFQIEYLNEDVTEADDLIKVLTAKNILPGSVKIQIGCETKHFRYTIDKFQPYFNSLTLANIAKSKLFYSKKDTLITANNLSASNSKSKIDPKEKATIDKIFKNLQ
ncbi:MAG: hypothetical protein IT253_05625 [Chitinophagaceae bacterium]|nr:hypothetical protein [Chitinophagaceae bacterium]